MAACILTAIAILLFGFSPMLPLLLCAIAGARKTPSWFVAQMIAKAFLPYTLATAGVLMFVLCVFSCVYLSGWC